MVLVMSDCSCSIHSDSVRSLSPGLVFGVACGRQLIVQVEHVDLVACTIFVQLFYFVATDRVEGANAETRRRSSKAVFI